MASGVVQDGIEKVVQVGIGCTATVGCIVSSNVYRLNPSTLNLSSTRKMPIMMTKKNTRGSTGAHGARMRRVEELVKAGENAEQFYTPLALRLSNMTRYPSWDPTGQAIDRRATILPGER